MTQGAPVVQAAGAPAIFLPEPWRLMSSSCSRHRKETTMTFDPSQFTPTQWETAKDKTAFANRFVRFVQGDFAERHFTEKFYQRLSNCFGHIAHYNRGGFFETFFTTTADKVRFWKSPCGGRGAVIRPGPTAMWSGHCRIGYRRTGRSNAIGSGCARDRGWGTCAIGPASGEIRVGENRDADFSSTSSGSQGSVGVVPPSEGATNRRKRRHHLGPVATDQGRAFGAGGCGSRVLSPRSKRRGRSEHATPLGSP